MTGLTRFRDIFALGAAGILVATVTLVPRVASAQALPSYLRFLPGKLTLRPAEYQDWDQYQIPLTSLRARKISGKASTGICLET
jgi:hypothetical protein